MVSGSLLVADYAPTSAAVKAGTFRLLGPYIRRGQPAASDVRAVADLYARFTQADRIEAFPREPVIAICAWGEAEVSDWAHQYGNL
jgi:alpha-galactosidase